MSAPFAPSLQESLLPRQKGENVKKPKFAPLANTPRPDGKPGNGCEHNPWNPRRFVNYDIFRYVCKKKIPKLIQASIKEVSARAETVFQSLRDIDRKIRSERIEACDLVLGCLFEHMDLATMRVAFFNGQTGEITGGLGYEYIAAETGLSIYRVHRAMRDLSDEERGFVTVHPIAEKLEECVYVGFNAIITVSNRVFELIGKVKWLYHERRKASKRLGDKLRKLANKAKAAVQDGIDRLTGHSKPSRPEPKQQGLQHVGEFVKPMCPAALTTFATAKKLHDKSEPQGP